MMSKPWLTLIGLGEDGLSGLSDASLDALSDAEIIFGAPRHLSLAKSVLLDRGQTWPIPFSTVPLLAQRGRPVCALVSGDPFWFGAGGSLLKNISAGEWRSFPNVSAFSLTANRLGWRIEETFFLGLHATSFAPLRSILAQNTQVIITLRDGEAVVEAVAFLNAEGWHQSDVWVLRSLSGPQESLIKLDLSDLSAHIFSAPLMLAIHAKGSHGLARSAGLCDDMFSHDGQITKSPVRALTLSALAPRRAEVLWDLGAGSGSVSVEWCLAGGRAVAVEKNSARAKNISKNIAHFGLERLMTLICANHHDDLDLPSPDAVFIGGGANIAFLTGLITRLPRGCRMVINGVTLETEALLALAHEKWGGDLLRIELASVQPLGRMRGWQASRAVVQWSVTL
jgi:precorrin-6Y C5,15-methyltransferase (decarboxylating)